MLIRDVVEEFSWNYLNVEKGFVLILNDYWSADLECTSQDKQCRKVPKD